MTGRHVRPPPEANIDGAVTNAGGGKIISGGGGATIFYDDVTNHGEIRTSTVEPLAVPAADFIKQSQRTP
jgi:hypothetical protein